MGKTARINYCLRIAKSQLFPVPVKVENDSEGVLKFLKKHVGDRANGVARKYPGKVMVTRIAALPKERGGYKAASIPVVLVNDKAIATGQAISEYELEKAIKKEELEVQA